LFTDFSTGAWPAAGFAVAAVAQQGLPSSQRSKVGVRARVVAVEKSRHRSVSAPAPVLIHVAAPINDPVTRMKLV
jgi:hypothetical protein